MSQPPPTGHQRESGDQNCRLIPKVLVSSTTFLTVSFLCRKYRFNISISRIFYLSNYRVTRRVFSEPVTSKLHLLYTKNLAGHLKTPKVTRISAMYTNFSHSIVHSGPICFCMTKNLKLSSRTNKSK